MTPSQKRKIRDAKNKAGKLDAQHRHEVSLAAETARMSGYADGHRKGYNDGMKFTRDAVLEHSGRLFKEGKDDSAKAVRDVQRLLPISV